MRANDLVKIGYVLRPHGVRGALRVHADGDALLQLERIYLDERERRIVRVQRERADFLVELEGLTDRTAAEAYKGAEVACDRDALPPAEPGQAYVADLVGCRVERPDGGLLGEVVDVVSTGAQDLLLVRDGAHELYIPLVDAIVPTVDLAARRVVCDPPDGLLELNRRAVDEGERKP
jgi:16S rRNA processing protein RimM